MTKNCSLRHVTHRLDSPADADLLASNSLEIRLACSSADWEIAHPMLKQEHSLGLSLCELPIFRPRRWQLRINCFRSSSLAPQTARRTAPPMARTTRSPRCGWQACSPAPPKPKLRSTHELTIPAPPNSPHCRQGQRRGPIRALGKCDWTKGFRSWRS